ncbi:MAG: hypothetical protein Q9175_008333 [Cornicularia normoerica]
MPLAEVSPAPLTISTETLSINGTSSKKRADATNQHRTQREDFARNSERVSRASPRHIPSIYATTAISSPEMSTTLTETSPTKRTTTTIPPPNFSTPPTELLLTKHDNHPRSRRFTRKTTLTPRNGNTRATSSAAGPSNASVSQNPAHIEVDYHADAMPARPSGEVANANRSRRQQASIESASVSDSPQNNVRLRRTARAERDQNLEMVEDALYRVAEALMNQLVIHKDNTLSSEIPMEVIRADQALENELSRVLRERRARISRKGKTRTI